MLKGFLNKYWLLSVILKRKYILNNYVVDSKKKIIEIVLESETKVLRLKATNEGEIKPNTTVIRIIDGENKYELNSNLKKWGNAFIPL